MKKAGVTVPQSIDGLTRDWFDSILDERVLSSEIIKVVRGTATKIHVRLEVASEGGASQELTVWVKTGMESVNNAIKDHAKIYAGETFFYRELGGRFETRTPHCYFADSDDDGNSVQVLADLEKAGARFIEPTEAQSPDVIAKGLDAVARYQAASWESPELKASDYLMKGGFYAVGNVLDWMYNEAHWEEYSRRPRFQALAPQLRNRDMLLTAHKKLKSDWWPHAPLVLTHSDAHVGQLYTLPDGEVRLLDWQCVRMAHWGFDPCNIIVTGLSIDDRRSLAKDLLQHYVSRLKAFGVENGPTVDDAFAALRAYALHGVGWVMCMAEMQPEENCLAITERASAAAVELGTINAVMAGPQPLGR